MITDSQIETTIKGVWENEYNHLIGTPLFHATVKTIRAALAAAQAGAPDTLDAIKKEHAMYGHGYAEGFAAGIEAARVAARKAGLAYTETWAVRGSDGYLAASNATYECESAIRALRPPADSDRPLPPHTSEPGTYGNPLRSAKTAERDGPPLCDCELGLKFCRCWPDVCTYPKATPSPASEPARAPISDDLARVSTEQLTSDDRRALDEAGYARVQDDVVLYDPLGAVMSNEFPTKDSQ